MSSPDSTGTTTETKPIGGGLSLNMSYIKSIPGILTAAYTVVSLIAFICVYASWWCNWGARGWFGFVSMTAFLVGLVNYIIYVLSIYEKLGMVPWNFATLIWCGVWTFFYLIASAVMAANACVDGIIAGSIFGFLAMVLIAARGYFAFVDFRAERSASSAPPASSTGAPPPYSQGGDFVQY